MRGVLGLLCFAGLALGAPATDLARAIRENQLDRDACYRIRDFTLFKEDIRIYLNDGYLIFSKPVAGQPVAALFTADVENGGAEVILRPPNAAERHALASYIDSPNLDERFESAMFFFTGEVYQQLMDQLPNNPANRRAPEIGALLEEKWNPVLRGLTPEYDLRIAMDLLNTTWRKPDFFSAAIRGVKLGTFDVFYDPDNSDQVAAGQYVTRDNRWYFDTWMHFPARQGRNAAQRPPLRLDLSGFRIDATVDSSLVLSAVTRVKVKTVADGLIAVPFNIAGQMAISEVKVDGAPGEFLQREESARSAVTSGENSLFLVIPPAPLRSGVEYEFEFHHSGKVILDGGDHVYYVAARGNWYPNLGPQLTTFDLTFHYPRGLELVTPGEVLEDRVDGQWRITRRRPADPIRLAGFNLGDYVHSRVSRGQFVVDVCANRSVELQLRPRPDTTAVPAPVPILRRTLRNTPPPDFSPPRTPDPLARLEQLASDIGGMVEFMASKFGPPALRYLTVSPIPGNFGQGYPGLIYLSTKSYLAAPALHADQVQTTFFDELLALHETAHQWWGAQVSTASYRDEWLMEALANYSALLYVERTKGEREVESILDQYRADLLAKRDNGEPVESAGPIVLGSRLESSLDPRAWRAITYGKGSWIVQMLRRRMGDERFLSLLAEIVKQYRRSEITTEGFRNLASQFLPLKSEDPKLEDFFDQWVYGTGIPALKLSYTVKSKAPKWQVTGTLTQSGVSGNFSVLTPVEIQLPRAKPITHWVSSSNEPVTFTVDLQQTPLKVVLDPHHAILRR